MRIVSPFKDYYDHGMAYYSPEPLYIREPVVTRKHPWHEHELVTYITDRGNLYEPTHIEVYFCGKYYPALKIAGRVYYTPEAIIKDFPDIPNKNEWREEHITGLSVRGLNRTFATAKSETGMNDFHKTPIVVGSYNRVDDRKHVKEFTLNANLSTIEFFRAMNPYSTFQEIEMWLNNQAAPERPIPAVSNNDMIEAKGFDLKSSFRKEKQKK